MKNTPRLRDELFELDVAVRDAFADFEFREFDVEPEKVAALSRNDEDAALVGRLDQALAANVREVGDRKNVHHAPGVVCGVAMKLAPDCSAHRAVRAIAADHVTSLDHFCLSLMRGIKAFQRDADSLLHVPTATRLQLDRNDTPRIIRLQFGGGSPHGIEIE